MPIAGVAAHVCRDDKPAEAYWSSSLMCPLPLSAGLNIPVTILGCFLVRHNQGRYLFRYQNVESLLDAQCDAVNQLIEAWNRELMSCVCDSYIEIVLEMQKLRTQPSTSALGSGLDHNFIVGLNAYDNHYSFWPRSSRNIQINQSDDGDMFSSNVLKADWQCVIDQVIRPFYVRVIDLPVWQLYSGNLVKAEEGMFLSKPETGVGANMLPDTVCAFVKEQYPVFSVPWELMTEIQAVGVMVRQIKPKMVRSLLKISSTSIVLRCIDTFADVLEYCLSDIHIDKPSNPSTSEELAETIYSDYPPHKDDVSSSSSAPITGLHKFSGMSDQRSASSGGDALEVVASLGRALFDFGRGVVGDIGRTGGPLVQRNTAMGSGSDDIRRNWDQELLLVAAELKGLPCPTAGNRLVKLGFTEVWVGNKEQQVLMTSLAAKFVHLKLMDRPILANIFLSRSLQALLKLQSFSLHLLAENMRLLFHENWVSYVLRSNMAPCFSWENTTSCSAEQGPSPEWIRLFWKCFTGSLEDLSLFADWPLIPAFLGRRVLCRVRQRHLVFIPPPFTDTDSAYTLVETRTQETNMNELLSESECIKAYSDSFEDAKTKYPWLLSFLNQCNIPIFDTAFLDCAAQCNCFPTPGSSLGQVIACKLAAAKYAGYIPELNSLSAADCDELLSLLSSDFTLNRSRYGREELEVLRDLPVFRTVVGSYTRLHDQELCLISSNSFLKPYHEHCLSYSTNSSESSLLQALGVPVLHDEQIFVRFGLPGFEGKPQSEQEDVLIYLYENWQDFQHDSSVTEALRETNFVRNAEEFSIKLSKPKDLFDPGDVLLTSIFSAEREKFPGERFSTDGWLRILRKTGLRTAAEPDVILDCARKVESLVSECTKSGEAIDDFDSFNSQNEVPIEIWLLAESVVKAIFSNFAFLYGANFCNILGKIACVPAVKGFPNGGGKRGEKRVLCSFSEAILLKDWPLAWSCAPILSRQCVVPPEYSWGALYLRSPPSFSTVLKHLQVIGRNNGEDTLAHWPTTLGLMTIEEASFEVLKYLDKVWGSLSASDITELQRVAFVPAANGTRLVTANSLFARLTINLSPFAFELPSMYLPFVKILKDMGLQDMLSVACAQDLLLNLQRACGYHRLNPNELRAVVEILHFICEKTNESNMPGKSWELDAIVLDDGCRLVHARSCVYVDSYGSQYIKYIDTSRLRLVNPDIPERICTTLGIKKLSDVVVEELDDAEHLQTMGQIGSVALVAIRQKLSCKSFQTAVWKVVNSVNSGILDFNGLTLEKLQTLLDLVAENLKFVRYLYTRFLLLPKSLDITRVVKESVIPEWEGGSQHRTLYFIDRMKTCMLVAEPPSYISVLDIVAIIVSQVLGCSVHLPIVPLFLCPDGSEIAIVNILKLHSEKGEDRCIGGKNCLLGRELLAQDAIHVQLHPLRPFYSGEFVAWRSQNGDKLKYGRVLEDVRPSAGQALYRLRVEVGLGVTEHLLSSHVFSFKGVLIDNEAFIDTKVKDDHLVNENVIQVDEPEVSGRGKSHSTQARIQV
ncbi:hypothetical protein NMG60_11024176 [Bertholletia excelsa]